LIHPHQQIASLKQDPLQFVSVGFTTLFAPANSDPLVSQYIGNLGWLDTPLPSWLIVLTYILMFYVGLRLYEEGRPRLLPRVTRLASAAIALAILGGIMAVLYVTYTPVGHPWIDGVQGRYFIALSVLLVPIAAGRQTQERVSAGFVIGSLVIIQYFALATLVARFYLLPV
jgi:uncharacterized membrane protein